MNTFTPRKRFISLFKKVQLIESQLDLIPKKHLSSDDIIPIVRNILPSAKFIGMGAAKVAFTIKQQARFLVLKFIKNASRMPNYIRPYHLAGKSQKARNHSFLKHYWFTKYTILQKFAKPIDVNSQNQKQQIKKLRKKYSNVLSDLGVRNLGVDNNIVKIIDAQYRRNYEEI